MEPTSFCPFVLFYTVYQSGVCPAPLTRRTPKRWRARESNCAVQGPCCQRARAMTTACRMKFGDTADYKSALRQLSPRAFLCGITEIRPGIVVDTIFSLQLQPRSTY